MSNSDHKILPTAMSDSDNSQEIKPMSVSSSDVDEPEPPLKRARTFSHINQECLQQTGPPQENPTDIVGPSQLTSPRFSFVCSLRHARHLKFAIEALCDPVHNKLGSGRIDVDVNGFHVTVQNKNTNAVGHLFLKPSGFEFNKPIEGMTVNLPALSMCKEFADVQDDDALDIFSVEGSNILSFFTFGTKLTTEFPVKLLENNDKIPKFPELSYISCASLPSKDLRLMLEHLLRHVPHEVFVEITENSATLRVGHDEKIENSWKAEYPMVKVAAGRWGVEQGKRYCASFQWTNAQWLNKASDKDTTFEVSLHTTERPTYMVVLRFFLKREGYLEYAREAIP